MGDVEAFLAEYRALLAELDANPFGFLPAEGDALLQGYLPEARARLTPLLQTKDGSMVVLLDGAAALWVDSEGVGPFALAASPDELLSVLPYGATLYDIASALARRRDDPFRYEDPAARFAEAYASRIVGRAALATAAPPVEPDDLDDEAAWEAYSEARDARRDGFVDALAWIERRAAVSRDPHVVLARVAESSVQVVAWVASQRAG